MSTQKAVIYIPVSLLYISRTFHREVVFTTKHTSRESRSLLDMRLPPKLRA